MKAYQIKIISGLPYLHLVFFFLVAFSNTLSAGFVKVKVDPGNIFHSVNIDLHKKSNPGQKPDLLKCCIDSLPKTRKNTVIIPFEYKQSALYQPFTFKAIDSVIDILLGNEMVTLSIEGFAHVDEGSDSICYWLSLNRALVIKDYIMGRGIDSLRILSLIGYGNVRSADRKAKNQSVDYNCRTEIMMNYPIPPPPLMVMDKDEDGIIDSEDQCPGEYGYIFNKGCPNRGAIIVPFEPGQSALFTMTYNVLDSVINILLQNPSYTITIEGHACKREGIESFCDQMARERGDITKRYLLTRNINSSRILSVSNYGNTRPLNACKNPQQIAQNSRAEIYLNSQ